MTRAIVKDTLGQPKGARMIVYSMGLLSHGPIRMELVNNEDLSGKKRKN